MIQSKTELILDTHLWIWLVRDDQELKASIRSVVDAASAEGMLFLSTISVWEVAMLANRRRIKLTKPAKEWVTDALAVPGLNLADLTPEVMIEAYDLPAEFHGDPADRMLVATARLRGATLATRDRRILEYGEHGHLSVLAA